MVEPAQVTHDPLAVLVEVRDAVLESDVEATAELRVVVDQAVQAHEGDPRIIRALDLARRGGGTFLPPPAVRS